MSNSDEMALGCEHTVQTSVHQLRDYTHGLEFISTATTISGGLPLLLGRLGNVADHLADSMRRLQGHAAGGDDPVSDVEAAASALQEISQTLRRLQDRTAYPLARAYSVISHREDPAATV